ncbi:helix-turn-helix domain-containing protein [Paracoccus yeei]|uniref:helix-turn-helix domain-containing protein n=1 Tax=Paracoccus yeei TaxID=147645 RepID=UPI0009E00A05|nr:hypothetical protein CDV54_20890 [Paracoccus yeei]
MLVRRQRAFARDHLLEALAQRALTEMARRMGRHRSTIFRELSRNHFHDSDIPKLHGDCCVVAQSCSDGRRTRTTQAGA